MNPEQIKEVGIHLRANMVNLKTIFGLATLANIFMFVGSIAMGRHDLAFLNFLSGMCCSLGYYSRTDG